MEARNLRKAVKCEDCGVSLHFGASLSSNNTCAECKKWRNLMFKMDIPEMRCSATVHNARWFLRNGWVRNTKHPVFDEAMTMAKRIAKRDE